MVNPTAVPIKAALSAVDKIDPARPFLLFAGGRSNSMANRASIPGRRRERYNMIRGR